ncbi:uncharacterized protein CTRU02_202144 [Colletotrichum truncatum]|uniref:Uncharacterized protein n=1 Tax=Colletotrichum truncatum TaxID=5467 RepID=A0ACC3ZK08_COLTU|nr:uncharacterized protein CTRU02_01306 [Colletotrichum truncatum]KAF6799627.1 hypothetical protein CTRU02_01306 [Colletotrichum truncatum]
MPPMIDFPTDLSTNSGRCTIGLLRITIRISLSHIIRSSLSMLKAYKNLSPKTRLGFGVAVLAWGGAGLYLSDRAEEKYKPTPQEKAVVDKYVPKVHVVDKS